MRTSLAPQLEKNLLKFLQYGVSQDLGQRAVDAALTITKVRSLSQKDLVAKGFSAAEAKVLKESIARQPIDEDVLLALLDRSNYVCNCCKGEKGKSFIIHHIEEYSVSQDNSYENLIVLCPTDHDLAHRSPNQLTLAISPEMLRSSKTQWEVEVERRNADRAVREPVKPAFTEAPAATLAAVSPQKKQMRIIAFSFEGEAGDFTDQKVGAIVDTLREVTGDAGLTLHATELGSFVVLVRTTADAREIDTPATRELLFREHGAVLKSVLDEASYRQAKLADEELDWVPRALLEWPQQLPDGTHFDRPEKDEILNAIAGQESTTLAVLGLPGSGKSALLAEVANALITDGVKVLAIKADLLEPTIESEKDLGDWLGLSILPSALLWRVSQLCPIVLVIDQLDALAGYTDIKTGRLSVLLSLVRRVSGRKNVHVVLSAREFEYQHDVRLKTINAETIHLDLPAWADIVPVLERNGFSPAGWPADAQEVMRRPQALDTFLNLKERRSEPYPKYQQMLDQMWAETITRHPRGAALAKLVSDIADEMADKEVLWLPAARFDQHAQDVTYLVSAGMLSDLGEPGSKIGFSHQTVLEHALARSFTQTAGRLSEFVLVKQTSLFVRPKLWAALTYLREVDPGAYDSEIETLFHTPDLQLHVHRLLVEFMGQQAAPDRMEAKLFDEALASDRRPTALMAMGGSPGWFDRYKHTELPRAMQNEAETGLAMAVLTLAWPFASDFVERLIVDSWAKSAERDHLTWATFDQALVWTPRMLEVARQIIGRTAINAHRLEYTVSAIGTAQPDIAIALLETILTKELQAAKAESARRLATAPQSANDTEYWKWRTASSPRKPITDVLEQANLWETLDALATAQPAPFLDAVWPLFRDAMSALGDLEDEKDVDSIHYPVRFTLDFKFTEEDRKGRAGPPILSAIRVALETLAESDEGRFLAWLAGHESEEFAPAQRLFAHVLSLHPDTLAQRAFGFLAGDPRRLRLGSHEDASGTSKRLIAETSPKWSDGEVDTFVTMVNSYSPPPYPDLDAKGRQNFQNRLRIFRLGLLSALPPDRLPAASRRLVREEQRRFPRSDAEVRRGGPAWIGSPVSAEQLGKARDEDVLNAFREVPDKHEWNHPNRMMEGGNIQLSRAFAEFAKADPKRAARLIRNFEPSFGTRAAGYAVQAIAEAGDAELVMRLILELDDRGFTGEEFTSSASEAISRLVRRDIAISAPVLDLVEKWLFATESTVTGPVQADDRDDDLELLDTAEEPAGGGNAGTREATILWRSSRVSALPAGNFPKLDVLVHALVLASHHDRALAVLTKAFERGESERVWQAILHWFHYLRPSDGAALEQLLAAVLERYPDLRRSDEFAELLAYLHWRHPDFVRQYLEPWATSGDDYFEQLAGELTALIALVRPEVPWTVPLLQQVVFDGGTDWTRVGAINTAVNLFSNVDYRQQAADLLVRIIPQARGAAWNSLFDIFRIVDEITPDPAWVALLTAIEANLDQAPAIDATFVVDRLQTLLPDQAPLVARIAKRLIAAWSGDLADIATSIAGAASELVDLAITLHRAGDETREIGLELFEQLVEIQAYGAKETLEQIDNRFRSRTAQRQRLPRRSRRAGRNSTTARPATEH
jgi:hypothetical protein